MRGFFMLYAIEEREYFAEGVGAMYAKVKGRKNGRF